MSKIENRKKKSKGKQETKRKIVATILLSVVCQSFRKKIKKNMSSYRPYTHTIFGPPSNTLPGSLVLNVKGFPG